MRRSSLFGHIAELLGLVVSSRHPADSIVREFFQQRRYLGSHDRRFISDYLYGILRHHSRLATLVRIAVAGLRDDIRMDRIPAVGLCAAYALRVAGEESVSLEPDIAGLWRTVTPDIDPTLLLKALQRAELPEDILADPVRRIAVEQSLPEPIVREWIGRFGPEEGENLCRAMNEPAPTFLRVNTLRCSVDECMASLSAEGVATRRTQLSPHGLVLEKRLNVQGIRAFRDGCFEVQDEGSQIISLLTGAGPGQKVVDACAGAGGKTLHMAMLMQNSGAILALDSGEGRMRNLRLRAARAGVSIITEAILAGGKPLPEGWEGAADAVLVDAPCSGIGTFRRNPGAKLQFSESFVSSISRAQYEILDRSAAFLKSGGHLVYSTCTIFMKENEDIVTRFLGHHPEFELLPAQEMLLRSGVALDNAGPCLLLLPHRHGTDGFFAAVFRKSVR
jgi:16S rRNA (cytosine967-C5)-methyltransferase